MEESSSEAHETDPELNTAEKQRLKKELMMMGYDEDSYGEHHEDDYEEPSEGEDQLTKE